MPSGTVEDKDDVFINNVNNALLLFLGVLAVFASAVLLTYSTILAIYSRQSIMDFLNALIFSGLFFFIGFGSLRFLQKRRKQRKEKESRLF